MKAFGITGASGSGKTTLITALLPDLRRRGLRVSTVKHAHHVFDLDRPGKDSWLHREAGAEEVMLVSGNRWALMRDDADEAECDLNVLLSRLTAVDLVLVEGFRASPIPKLEVWRGATGKPAYWPEDPSIIAVAADIPGAVPHPRTLPLSDIHGIADFILAEAAP